ncbi:MAG: hypothetical protein ACRCZF_18675, partial [Gemmataceae bacterium]
KLQGTIAVAGLPPHGGLIVSLCFYRVVAADIPAPYGGDPPAEAATDCHEAVKRVDLDAESSQSTYELPFNVERPDGFYYLQVRAILFRVQVGKVLAHAEQFFFGQRPVQVVPGSEVAITLPVSWPALPVEELHHYGTVLPQCKRPWWRFW